MLVSALFAFSRGQDVNYDQLNYHYYYAYAFVQDRMDSDAAPAQIFHSYFNPLAFLPFYIVFSWWGAAAASVILGAIHGINLVLVGLITNSICCDGTSLQRRLSFVAAVVISAASPMALCELGTSYTDILCSIPALAAVALLLRTRNPHIGRFLMCGTLVGFGVALKLTNATFAIRLAGACIIRGHGLMSRMRALAAVSTGLILGFLLMGGSWCLRLWQRFHNPVFPYFNSVFLSPDYRFVGRLGSCRKQRYISMTFGLPS
jgi:hypothetical protein